MITDMQHWNEIFEPGNEFMLDAWADYYDGEMVRWFHEREAFLNKPLSEVVKEGYEIEINFVEKDNMEKKIGIEEGNTCNRDGCQGTMVFEREGACGCHINPPCQNCVDAPLVCDECGTELEEE